MILKSDSFKKIINMHDTQSKRIKSYSKTTTLFVTVMTIGLLFYFSIALENGILLTDYNAYAQTEQQENNNSVSSDKVTIRLDSVMFAPLTNSDVNQLKVDITYQTNDPKLVNTIMAGVMKVYTTDGTLIKTSTIPDGFVLGQAGPMPFATSFEDSTIQDVKAEIAMTDTSNLEKISNTLMVEASLEK
jgi:hypothetical protein